jgi:hypothetical protein
MPQTVSQFEQIAQMVKNLPLEDYDKLRELIDEEKKKREKSLWRMKRYQKAKEWLAANGKKYMNQWVCLEGDKLIAHGADALEVHKKAVAAGVESPFLHHIVEELPWGGW